MEGNHIIDGSSGSTFASLLTVLFIGLKLTNHINWPWIWVLSPLWIGGLIAAFIMLLAFIWVMIFRN